MSGPGEAGAPATAATNNLALRVVSAAVLAPVALLTAYLGGWAFVLFWGIAAIAVMWEWLMLVAGKSYWVMLSLSGSAIAVAALVGSRQHPIAAVLPLGLGALAVSIFAPYERRLWVVAGVGYAGAMLVAPMLLRDDDADGFFAMVLLFAVVWTTDVLAYFTGRALGGPKLLPVLSPKKTWSGAIAGALGATIVVVPTVGFFGAYNKIAIAIVALLLSISSQCGDLLESSVKRRFGAKDASHLIPGHGGAMDRLDGFWAAAVVACVIGLLRGGLDAPARGLLVW